jgi:hypothetical protein
VAKRLPKITLTCPHEHNGQEVCRIESIEGSTEYKAGDFLDLSTLGNICEDFEKWHVVIKGIKE